MTSWDKFFDEKIKEIASYCRARNGKILDLGGGQPFMKHMAKYKSLFDGLEYLVVDNVAKYQPDIVADITNLSIEDNFADAVVCKAVLEHVPEPHKAVLEMYRVLKPGGKVFIYVPFLYSYHGNNDYKDYYRYTRDGLEFLFKDFSTVEIVSVRGAIETWLYLLPFKFIRKFAPLIRHFDKKTKNQASGYNLWAVK